MFPILTGIIRACIFWKPGFLSEKASTVDTSIGVGLVDNEGAAIFVAGTSLGTTRAA